MVEYVPLVCFLPGALISVHLDLVLLLLGLLYLFFSLTFLNSPQYIVFALSMNIQIRQTLKEQSSELLGSQMSASEFNFLSDVGDFLFGTDFGFGLLLIYGSHVVRVQKDAQVRILVDRDGVIGHHMRDHREKIRENLM